MSFLFPGKTKCPICDEPIEKPSEATRLPYVDLNKFPELGRFFRCFIHRKCWPNWNKAKAYAQAAYELVVEASPEDFEPKICFAREQVIIFWVEALNSYRLEDFDLLVTVEIPAAICTPIIDFLYSVSLQRNNFDKQAIIGCQVWSAKPMDSNIEIEIIEGKRVLSRFRVSKQRLSLWLSGLDKVIFTKKDTRYEIEQIRMK